MSVEQGNQELDHYLAYLGFHKLLNKYNMTSSKDNNSFFGIKNAVVFNNKKWHNISKDEYIHFTAKIIFYAHLSERGYLNG